jgi:replicative DNA helicase
MAQISRETFNFTQDFQDLILACVLKRPEFVKYASVIEAKYFSGPIATITARAIFAYYKRVHSFPTKEMLLQIMSEEAKKQDEQESDLSEYVNKLFKIKTLTAWEEVHKKVIAFCRERAVLRALVTGAEAFKAGETPEGGYVRIFEKAMAVGAELEDIGVMVNTDAAGVIRPQTQEGYGISTGYPALDKVWRNGWQPGWLIVPLAPPKRLKTTWCINLAINMAKNGLDVIYYACEINQYLAAIRAIQNLTDTEQDEIYTKPKTFIRSKLQQGLDKLKGKFLIKSFASKSAKISDIESHYMSVVTSTDMEPKAVFIDYAETVAPEETKNISEHQQQASVYTSARAFAARAGVVCVMPDRCTREATDAVVPNMKAFQGSYQKAGIVDVAIGLCATEKEMMEGVMRYFVFLNRHGESFGYFKGNVNAKKMQMDLQDVITYAPDTLESPGFSRSLGKRSKIQIDPVSSDDQPKWPERGQ